MTYEEKRTGLLNRIRTGSIVRDYWGETWRVLKNDRIGMPRVSFYCASSTGGGAWVPFVNVKAYVSDPVPSRPCSLCSSISHPNDLVAPWDGASREEMVCQDCYTT